MVRRHFQWPLEAAWTCEVDLVWFVGVRQKPDVFVTQGECTSNDVCSDTRKTQEHIVPMSQFDGLHLPFTISLIHVSDGQTDDHVYRMRDNTRIRNDVGFRARLDALIARISDVLDIFVPRPSGFEPAVPCIHLLTLVVSQIDPFIYVTRKTARMCSPVETEVFCRTRTDSRGSGGLHAPIETEVFCWRSLARTAGGLGAARPHQHA